ncbi:MAG: diterpene synthase [Anaerolineae bacterium]
MDLETFMSLPTGDVARLVQERGPRVCVFPINGTRRWFVLEHPEVKAEDYIDAYLAASGQRHLELYQLFFDHGINTLVTPIFGPDLLERGEVYDALLEQGLTWFAREEFLAFYDAHDVRVRVYGDARRYLQKTVYASALGVYDEVTHRTADHGRHRLFFGVCAHDAAEAVAQIGLRFHDRHHRLPTKSEIVEAYYGEPVEPVDIFIGFDRPAAFDMPLIATGSEDLYFTVAPSPYLDETTLRAILFDHMYARHVDDTDYEELSADGWAFLDRFYRENRHAVLGLGRRHESGSFWYPLPQVRDIQGLAQSREPTDT